MLAPKLQLKRTNDTIRAREQRKDVKSTKEAPKTAGKRQQIHRKQDQNDKLHNVKQ